MAGVILSRHWRAKNPRLPNSVVKAKQRASTKIKYVRGKKR